MTDKDYYLSQFVILTLLVEFFDGQGSSAKSREYMRVGELQNCISKRLKRGQEPGRRGRERSREGLHFSRYAGAYEAAVGRKGLPRQDDERGISVPSSYLLQKQGLIDYVEEDEMIKTTKKLDNFMDWNLLNQNHFQRVKEGIGGG